MDVQQRIRCNLTDPPLLEVDIISGTDPTCNGLTDGTATALGTGGIVPLTYTAPRRG